MALAPDSPAPTPRALDVVRLTPEAERALRCGAALVDRSDRGKLALSGEDAVSCLQGQVTQDVAAIEPGDGADAAFLTTKGQMLGEVRIVRTADTLELDCDRVSLQALFDLLRVGVVGHDAELHKRTLQRGMLSLIGPKAKAIAHAEDLSCSPKRNAPFGIDGTPVHIVATAAGVDLLCDAEATQHVADCLVERGAARISEEAAEVHRIERGVPRYGVELDERTMPQEAGLLERAVSFTKGCYVGQETVARLYYRGKPRRLLRGLRFGGEPGADGEVTLDGKVVGSVRRVADSARFGMVALAVLRTEAEPGANVRCGGVDATVVELPFAPVAAAASQRRHAS